METTTVRRHEELLGEVTECHAEKVSVWKETSAENVNSLNYSVKIAKVDSIKMFVERNMILARSDKHVRALQTLVNPNVKRKVTLKGAMARNTELLESGRSIVCSEYSVNIVKLT